MNKLEEKEVKDNKIARVVMLRNRFFYMFYRSSMLLFLISLIMAIFATTGMVYLIKQPVPPQYIPIDEENRLIPLIPLNQAHKEDEEVKRFVLEGIKKYYTYDYVNYSDQIQEAKSYFTPIGWNDIILEFKNSNILSAVKENNWISTFQAKTTPIMKEKVVKNGYFTWALEFPVTITYIGRNGRTLNGVVNVIVSRTSIIDNSSGMGIRLLVLSEDKIN